MTSPRVAMPLQNALPRATNTSPVVHVNNDVPSYPRHVTSQGTSEELGNRGRDDSFTTPLVCIHR